MRVIMSGGTGFIGRYVVKELLKRKAEITILTSGLKQIPCSDPLLKIVYTTYEYCDLIEKLADEKFDIFYHLGWAGVGGKDKNDISLQLKNIQVSVDMMKLSKALGCKLFVAAGTVAEYVFNKDVIDFSVKQSPNDVYGATKVSVHYILEAVGKQLQQNMIWAVLPSTFGEGRTEDNIITYTITMLLDGKRPKYGELRQMWDFLYVTEVARAIVEIGEKGKPNMTYGIGSGEYRTLKDYVCVIRDMIDPALPLGIGEITSVGKDELSSSCVNIEQLTKDTGWFPQISFEEGIERTILYYKEHRCK